jgi:predicted transglutaminase-like cysteine proteinase
MRTGKLIILVIGSILGALSGAAAESSDAAHLFMQTGGVTRQPSGHLEFCKHHVSECSVISATVTRVQLTTQSWNDLVTINDRVNRSIFAVTDMEAYGRQEWWAYPTRQGDCEDVALLKRRDLIQRGYPVGALLITVVKRPNGEGHAVLTVLTDRGDFVLDNLDGTMRLWSETPYAFVKRQSEYNSGRWTAILGT